MSDFVKPLRLLSRTTLNRGDGKMLADAADEIERLEKALELAGHTPAQYPSLTDIARGHSFLSKEWGQKADGGHWCYTQNRETQGCYICAMMHEIEKLQTVK